MQVVTTDNTSVTFNTGSILDSSSYVVPGNLAGTTNNIVFSNSTSSPGVLHASDVVIGGKKLSNILTVIQQRLFILDDPSPNKLEKYAALKKAYEHYKLLEKLIGEENNEK